MLPSNPQPLNYESPKVRGPAPAQLSVVCLLVVLQLVGCVAGRTLWSAFFRGKDPQVEFFTANGAGLALFAVLCYFFHRRLGRFRVLDALLAFGLGVLSSLVGMGWGILDGYGW
jgi:hypothetical protein